MNIQAAQASVRGIEGQGLGPAGGSGGWYGEWSAPFVTQSAADRTRYLATGPAYNYLNWR